mgnify:CR=1 FL=1
MQRGKSKLLLHLLDLFYLILQAEIRQRDLSNAFFFNPTSMLWKYENSYCDDFIDDEGQDQVEIWESGDENREQSQRHDIDTNKKHNQSQMCILQF